LRVCGCAGMRVSPGTGEPVPSVPLLETSRREAPAGLPLKARKIKMNQQNLKEPAAVDLAGAGSIGAMAQAEGMVVDDYAVSLARTIRAPGNTPLSNQRARLQALAQAGAGGDLAAADSLSQHYLILEALFTRFAWESGRWLQSGDKRASEYSERYLTAAVKAQAAAARCLSALKVLRDAPSASNTPTAPAIVL